MNKIFALHGCYATLIRSELPTFRDNLSVPSSRVKQSKTIRYIFVFAENGVEEELTPTRPGPIRIPNCTVIIMIGYFLLKQALPVRFVILITMKGSCYLASYI